MLINVAYLSHVIRKSRDHIYELWQYKDMTIQRIYDREMINRQNTRYVGAIDENIIEGLHIIGDSIVLTVNVYVALKYSNLYLLFHNFQWFIIYYE